MKTEQYKSSHDYPRVGDFVRVIGQDPAWHAEFYQRAKLPLANLDPWAWTYPRANGEITYISREDDVVSVDLDNGSTTELSYEFDFTTRNREHHVWIVT